ncbi:hypothetical protein LF1_39750 [Rubripirellula obstinata]|uniref:Uncharacterized protein n=2 Tax=Rubripirellula obstinata TaxID=406547 RepID=A0A5B1CJR6_9BACT|nr:hypothetical protein [Rubripirellula obstinata]KAA1261427.1 hypothetical protein LF1_39750 [Rubripirellula obstinata]
MTVMAVSGCATWKEIGSLDLIDKTSDARNAAPVNSSAGNSSAVSSSAGNLSRISASKVLLDVEFVNIDLRNTKAKDRAAIWDWVDESAVDNRQRYQLFENGMRAGLVVDPQSFRSHLHSMTATKDVVDEFLASASIASDIQGGGQQIAMRMGRRYELPLREPIEGSHVTLVRVDDQVVGRTLHEPQFLFTLQASELTPDSRMRLRLRPEIQHGQMRQQFVGGGSNSGLRIDQRRESWSLPSLDLDWLLGKDELIVITADQYPTSKDDGSVHQDDSCLATQMFTGKNADHRDEQLVLLIRVKQLPKSVPE